MLNADGSDCYAAVKAIGKFRTVPRTEGVSTTDLVGRMLLVSRDHLKERELNSGSVNAMAASPYTRVTKFVRL